MAIGLFQAVAALVSTCSRHMSQAARKLSRRQSGGKKAKKAESFGDELKTDREMEEEEMRGEDGLWRRTILMGEKCQPLDFSGAIYYDAEGRRLSEVPTPRSPLRSPLPSFAMTSPVTVG